MNHASPRLRRLCLAMAVAGGLAGLGSAAAEPGLPPVGVCGCQPVDGSTLPAEGPDMPAAAGCEPPKVEVLGPGDAPSIPDGTAVVRVDGYLDEATANAVEAALLEADGRADRILLRLNSSGGTKRGAVRILAAADGLKRGGNLFRTLVHQGDTCASACVLVFMGGARRYAGNASAWGFHGACVPGSNVPDPGGTEWMIAQLAQAGVSSRFIAELSEGPFLREPGVYWLSGYELAIRETGVVTDLVPAWQPEFPTR
jgi:hypothetical protein